MPHDRETIAAVAARLIVESELTDWTLARRKAAEQLGLSARGNQMPSDDEIIAEIKTHHALYGGEEHETQLREQRESSKDVEIELVNLGADVDARTTRDGASELRIVDADWPLKILVRESGQRRDARYAMRIGATELARLIAS
jgi:hypothetical protein